jgi:hypothetical protein
VAELAGAHDLGLVGVIATQHALQQGRVAVLYLTSTFEAQHPDDAELAVQDALAHHVVLRYAEGPAAAQLDIYGGLGARLRYRVD